MDGFWVRMGCVLLFGWVAGVCVGAWDVMAFVCFVLAHVFRLIRHLVGSINPLKHHPHPHNISLQILDKSSS